MEIIKSIQNRIYEIRGERVMLDFDLAKLYEVSTSALNQAVKRNILRFPKDFMFQLSTGEYESIKSQIDTIQDMSSQFVTTYPAKRPNLSLPYAFTEHGVAMLSGVLNSEKAIKMNIAIMRAFVEIRKLIIKQSDIAEIWEKFTMHDLQLSQIYEAIENLVDKNSAQKKWDERERIGFKK